MQPSRRLRIRMALGPCAAFAVLAACVGDDPSGGAPTAGSDAGTSSSSSGGSSGSGSSSSGASGSSSSGQPADGGDAAAPLAGDVDPTFGGGLHPFALDGASFALRSVAIDASGGLAVAGRATDEGTCSAAGAFGVMRLTTAGAPNLAFGGTGAVCWRAGSLVDAAVIAVAANDDVVVVGPRADEDYDNPPPPSDAGTGLLSLVRLAPNGTVASKLESFAPNGSGAGKHVRTRALAVFGSDILLSGFVRDPRAAESTQVGFVMKLGFTAPNYVSPWSQSDGTVRSFVGVGFAANFDALVAGKAPSDTGVNQDSFLIQAFGTETGTPRTPISGVFERPVQKRAEAVAMADPAGKPLVLGGTNVEPSTGVATVALMTRFSGTSLDPSFAAGGIAQVTGLRFRPARMQQPLTLDAQGRILLLAIGADGMPVLQRFTAAGAPDQNFGTAGKVHVLLPTLPGDGGAPVFAHGIVPYGHVVADADSRITVVFPSTNGFYAVRYVP